MFNPRLILKPKRGFQPRLFSTVFALLAAATAAGACGDSGSGDPNVSDGRGNVGGSSTANDAAATGGASASGGSVGVGGLTSDGGPAIGGTGGTSATGGTSTTGGTTGSGGASGSGGDTAETCTEGDALAKADLGDDTPDGTGTAVTAITITNVGGSGEYEDVIKMAPGEWPPPCSDDEACVKQTKQVSGALAPFNEELTLNLRGPLELYDLAVYVPNGESYARTSYWNRCESQNIVFMNNLGGDVSGEWSVCGGNSQSYASSDGTAAASMPTPFSGSLANGVEVNALTAAPCTGAPESSDCGFYRNVGMHGWKGSADGEKVFALRMRMPRFTGTTDGPYHDEPAFWILNAKIVRTAQYGCNCRGVGPGGCGELDVAEVLNSDHRTHATSTIYSFQGAIGADGADGTGHYFLRPVNEAATFVVIFNKTNTIKMLRLPADGFSFSPSITNAQIAEWNEATGFQMALP